MGKILADRERQFPDSQPTIKEDPKAGVVALSRLNHRSRSDFAHRSHRERRQTAAETFSQSRPLMPNLTPHEVRAQHVKRDDKSTQLVDHCESDQPDASTSRDPFVRLPEGLEGGKQLREIKKK